MKAWNRLRRILKFSLFAFGCILIGDYSAYNGKVTYSTDPAHPVGSTVSSGSSTSSSQSNAAAVAASNKGNAISPTVAPAAGGAQSAANSFGASDGTYYPTAAARDAHQATINAAHGVTTTAPATTTTTAPAATTPTTTAPATTTAPTASANASTSSQLLTQLQSIISSMLPSQTALNAPSSAQIGTLANQYAQLQVDPQLTALQNQLATAQTQEQGQISQIQAANSQLPQEAQTMLTNARTQAMDDAAARGAGTSGVYDYDNQQLSTPIMEQVNAANAQSTASQQAAINQLATTNANIGTQQTALGTQQGQIASQYAESLNEYYTSAANQDFQGMVNAALAYDAIGVQLQLGGSVVPGTVQVGASGQAQAGLPVGTTVDTAGGNYTITGTNPSGGYTSVPATGSTTTAAPATSSAPTGVTDLATAVQNAGGTITWNPVNQSVTIVIRGQSQTYTPAALQAMGAMLDPTTNHWTLPASLLSKFGVTA